MKIPNECSGVKRLTVSTSTYIPYMSRVVVIGGGVIGCAVAERLSLDRHQVTLLERDQLAARASGAAAGELSPSTRPGDSESLAMFPELVARIEKDSAMNVEYRIQQGLGPVFTKEEAVTRKKERGRWLEAAECRKLEPALSPDAIGAVLIEHAHLTPPRFVRALARAAASRGAEICEGTPAIGFAIERREARAVRTPAGDLKADWVVVAAGPWSKEVAATAGVDVEVRPQRGQLAALNPGSLVLRRSVFWSSGYLVPKGDGTVIAGAQRKTQASTRGRPLPASRRCSTWRESSCPRWRPRAWSGCGRACGRSLQAASPSSRHRISAISSSRPATIARGSCWRRLRPRESLI